MYSSEHLELRAKVCSTEMQSCEAKRRQLLTALVTERVKLQIWVEAGERPQTTDLAKDIAADRAELSGMEVEKLENQLERLEAELSIWEEDFRRTVNTQKKQGS